MIKAKTPNVYSSNIIAAVIGILSLMVFGVVPMVRSTFTIENVSEVVTSYKSFSMIFGGTAIGSQITTNLIDGTKSKVLLDISDVKFNRIAFLAAMLVVIGIISAFYVSFIKQERERKIFLIIAGCFFILGGICLLLVKDSSINALSMKEYAKNFKLASGAIIASSLSFISGIITIVSCFIKNN